MPPFLTLLNRQSLFDQAIEVLSDPINGPESIKYNSIITILQNNELFLKYFSSPLKLEEFARLAKDQINYEVHEFGKVLVKEKESCDKLHIILRGTVQKFHQKGHTELAQEVHAERRRNSARARLIFGRPETREFSPDFAPRTSTDFRRGSITKKALINGVNRISLITKIFSERKSSISRRSISITTAKTVINLQSEESELSSPSSASSFSRRTNKSKVYYPVQEIPQRSLSPNISQRHNYSRFSKLQVQLIDDICALPATEETQLDDSTSQSQSEESPTSDDERACVIKFATVKNPELLETCYQDSVVKVKNIRTYGPGEYFTEKFHQISQPKENSMLVVSSEEAHFITITRDSFLDILNEMEERANMKHKFFFNLFPSFEMQEVIKFSQLFGQQCYAKDDIIYSQNDNTDQCIYLLHSGEVKLMTDLSNKKLLPNLKIKGHQNQGGKVTIEEVPVTCVVKGQFFGEEVLIKKIIREYTAIASSPSTAVYYLKPEIYRKFNHAFENFFVALKIKAEGKFAWRKEKADEIVENQLISPKHNIRPSIIYTPKTVANRAGHAESLNVNKRKLALSFGNPKDSPKLISMKSQENITVILEKTDSYKNKFSRIPIHARLNTEEPRSEYSPNRSSSSPLRLEPTGLNFRKELEQKKKPWSKSGRSAFYKKPVVESRIVTASCDYNNLNDLKGFPNIQMMRNTLAMKNVAMAKDAENIQIAKYANIHTAGEVKEVKKFLNLQSSHPHPQNRKTTC